MRKLVRIAFNPDLRGPMAALMFGSVISIGLVVVQLLFTGHRGHAFLVWNLFLAWFPLLFALLANDEYRSGSARRWVLFSLGAAWLLFFPNAPYICTDIVHLKFWFNHHFWIELALILLFALTGLLVGFVSLYVMQSIVRDAFGRWAGWLFVLCAAGLSSVGVYVGRFLRFNSWDVIVRPGHFARGVEAWPNSNLANKGSLTFLILFAAFLFVGYVMLYGLTHLSPVSSLSRPDQRT